MEDFIDYIRLILRVLGRKVLEPVVNKVFDSSIKEKVFQNRGGKGEAFAKLTKDGFVVLKGSTIANKVNQSAPKQVFRLIAKFEDYIDSSFKLIKDARFSSLSAAAGFVSGASINGNNYWVTEERVKLGNYLENMYLIEKTES